MAASQQAKRIPLFLGSYPITPASDVLHELSKHKNFGVRAFQAEDEIASPSCAAHGGQPTAATSAVTVTSGPGLALKVRDAIGLARQPGAALAGGQSTSSGAAPPPVCPPRPRRPT